MLPILKLIWTELKSTTTARIPEPESMLDPEQVKSYVKAYEWGGPTSALQLFHIREVSQRIQPGSAVVDFACGPGPLLLELAVLHPSCKFIAVDLSETMLTHLQMQIQQKALKNVSILNEDIRTTQSIEAGSIDFIISTSALHHLPQDEDLNLTFKNMQRILKVSGGFYLFDFGLLKSKRTRQILVQDLEKKAPPLTVEDYKNSLDACFPISYVVQSARRTLPFQFEISQSLFIDFFYFLKTPKRVTLPSNVAEYLKMRWAALSFSIKLEYLSLKLFQKRAHYQIR